MKRNDRILVRIVNACRDVRRASPLRHRKPLSETHAVRLYKKMENQPYPLRGAASSVLLFVCISLLGLISCVDNDYTNPDSDRVAVTFAPQIEGNEVSRAVDQTWSAGDKVGIAMITNGASLPAGIAFSQYQVSGAGTSVSLSPVSVDQTLFYPTDGSNVNFVAFSPYSDVIDNTITYTTFATQSTQLDMEKVDFLYHKGSTAYNKTSTTAALAFGHKLSKIIINVTTTSDATAVMLSSLNMAITGTPGSVTANLADGSITAGNTTATITPYHTSPDADTRVATAIIVPHDAKSGRTITFTTTEGNYKYTFPSDDFTFESNKVYTMNFKVTNQGAELTDATIDNWSAGTIDWEGKYMFELLDDHFSFTTAANTTTTMTFNSNLSTATVVLSTSATDSGAGIPEGNWVTGNLTTSDQSGYTQYTYTFNVTQNTNEPARYAYVHILNGATPLAVVPVKQQGTTYEFRNNAYIVKPGNKVIYIPVSRANEHVDWIDAAAGVTDDTATAIGDNDALTATILWSDVQDLVTVETYGTGATGAIKVTTTATSTTEGNAVVGVKVGGVIKWSWHIWVTNYEPTPIGTLGWMDRNLGATSNSKSTLEAERVKTHGLLYQWGRKDPFPGSVAGATSTSGKEPTLYNGDGTSFTYAMNTSEIAGLGAATLIRSQQSISYTVANPMTFIGSGSNSWQNDPAPLITDNNWGQDRKELYDPCPEGYRVPKDGSWGTSNWHSTHPWQSDYKGRDVSPYGGWYPGAGYRLNTTGKLGDVGSRAHVWSATLYSYTSAHYMYFSSSAVEPSYYTYYRTYGCAVRCIKEY